MLPLLALLGAHFSSLRGAPSAAASSASRWCPTSSALEWLPYALAELPADGSSAEAEADTCFASINATVRANATHGEFLVEGVGVGAGWPLCEALVTASSSFAWSPPVRLTPVAPRATMTWAFAFGADEAADVAARGLEVVAWPCGLEGTLASLLATLPLLDSNETTAARSNAAFMESRGLVPPLAPYVPPSAAAAAAVGARITSVAYIAISEWDFLGSLEALGTGRAGTSHSALLVRRGGELRVAESTFGWPGGDGVQEHAWADWLSLSDPVQSSALLVLRPELEKFWNETAFWEYFDSLAGSPYGVNNFFTVAFDVGDPLRSLPAPLTTRTFGAFLVSADAALGDADTGVFQPSYNASVFDAVGKALQARHPAANCSTLACFVTALAPLSLPAALASPEDPRWVYGGKPARVCSAFCAGGLAAGLRAAPSLPPGVWLETEQAPRDNVAAALWDTEGWTPETCPTGFARSGGASNATFCQFAGALFALPLDDVGSVGLYEGMNEACGSQWPDYQRCQGGGDKCEC